MSKQAFKRLRRALHLDVNRQPLPSFTSLGRYPMFYITADSACLCPDCVNKEIEDIDSARKDTRSGRRSGWFVEAVDVNYEDADLVCDHCGQRIEAAYVD